MYTRVVYDVHGKSENSFTDENFAKAEFSFDIMQLYILADYLDIVELTEIIQVYALCDARAWMHGALKP